MPEYRELLYGESGRENMKKKKRRQKSILLRVVILGVCVYMIVTLAGLWKTLNESRSQLAELQQEYDITANEIEELKAMLADGSQAKMIEKAARERLGYVFSDEQVFIDISGN